MQMENYTIQFIQNVNSVAEFRIANETIDKYYQLCNGWEPPGEQPTPWNVAKHDVPGEPQRKEVPPPVAWGPLEHFQAVLEH